MQQQIEKIIAKHIAAEKRFRVVTHYADGEQKCFDVARAGQAESYATGQRRKIGRNLIDRATGRSVRVTAVTIEHI